MKVLVLGAIGTVYGDIGTSPLYTMREAFGETGRLPLTPESILGVLSLVFWALILVVTIKYVTVVLRADNQGEGGIMALSALAQDASTTPRGRLVIAILAMIGTSLFFGDGVITPAISVLSAVEGLQVAAPGLRHLVVPLALVILVGIFLLQRRGTGAVGRFFGPIMLVWFVTLAAIGLVQVVAHPGVLRALSPLYAVRLFLDNHWAAFVSLAAVVLAITGAEALYADVGHFGRRPIQVAWISLILPALVMNYFGQGALLLHDPRTVENPFYLLAPSWAWYPLLILATLATVIASQAVISGAFSLSRQAVNLGYLPRLQIHHTSEQEIGQVYVPRVNWLLMVVVALVVVGFGSSSALAGAYGIAVTGTEAITSLLAYVVARRRWGWSRLAALSVFLVFLTVDLAFFSANVLKIPNGGWFPIGFAALSVAAMATWRKGRRVVHERRSRAASSARDFAEWIEAHPPTRVPGTAVFLTGNPDIVPSALLHNLKHNKVLHERVILLTVRTEDVPRFLDSERMTAEPLAAGFHMLCVRYGFFESPDIPRVLAKCRKCGPPFDIMQTSFFLSREKLLPKPGRDMNAWEEQLFIALNHAALDATEFFSIPPDRVIEVGSQIEL
jgi:KUP system potassium uptake protein